LIEHPEFDGVILVGAAEGGERGGLLCEPVVNQGDAE
jgi:hypothetical protein